MRATECGEEAWIVNREPMYKNRIEGAAEHGERAMNREAIVTKAKWRRSGGCAVKECALTWKSAGIRPEIAHKRNSAQNCIAYC